MSYMAAAARYAASYTQHSRYTTRNTTRNTTEMLPGAAFQVRTEKLTWTRGRSKEAFPARRPAILALSTRYQTGWDVTKRHACHAKRHDNLLGNL